MMCELNIMNVDLKQLIKYNSGNYFKLIKIETKT
jgi:hypothetical protein